MKKDLLIIAGLFGLIISLLFINAKANIFIRDLAPSAISSTQVRIGPPADGLEITADVAKTPQVRSRGLSQRESLSPNSGMLFVFDKVGQYSFWMKDVKFPLDIIWISVDKQIADITHQALPEPGVPDNLLRIYKPATPILYVLEVFGGQARTHDLRIGDSVEFIL